ncbi:1-phosphofructokinase [Lederbergia wuyishanensis]|uniref:Tagatose-6-phosphate kinase n=1 Tax=Lederbergia wuyishanensis TaxID=1347903 RepID=A0ABU0D471_9BACI|nr:1-phosphofructokinase [Lederbergia wuyishanensis]MCJ8008230.1 1-phosphofructokinase [Lederbergia wuyishanensis]MDQ0343181.1 tagatose 6-phosphate kinase [Lederbergia wuyishanensis]
MIVTVTLNPAIDISYRVNNFKINKGHRVENGIKTAGGKGLNVSRVLKQLGENPLCLGFLGGQNGEWIKRHIGNEGLEESFTQIREETRTCLAFLDEENSTQTELMEKGPMVAEEDINNFSEKYKHLLEEATMVIASGSLPAGLSVDFYREIAEKAKESNVPFILDTSGISLELAIEGKPFLIKPNKDEICQFAKRSDLSFQEMIDVAREICNKGVDYVLISLGADGAVFVGSDTTLRAEIPVISVVNPVGSGDSMVAGMAFALHNHYDIEECLKWACACGISNALQETTGKIDPELVGDLLTKIKVTPL